MYVKTPIHKIYEIQCKQSFKRKVYAKLHVYVKQLERTQTTKLKALRPYETKTNNIQRKREK